LLCAISIREVTKRATPGLMERITDRKTVHCELEYVVGKPVASGRVAAAKDKHAFISERVATDI